MKKKIWQKILSAFLSLCLLLNTASPLLLFTYAQETDATPTPEITQVVTPSPSLEPTPTTTPEPTIEPSQELEPTTQQNSNSPVINLDESKPASDSSATLTPSIWTILYDVATTTSPVVLNQTYISPQEGKVTVTFTKLPETPGMLSIKQITLSQEEQEALGAFSNKAYEITSTMEDGTFNYDLTLPLPNEAKDKDVEVKVGESVDELDSAETVKPQEKTEDVVKITGLTHFTFFVVVGSIDDENGVTAFPESNADVLINEFVYDTTETNDVGEWVELYNRGTVDVSLSGWTLIDKANTPVNLSGTIPAGGFAVFEKNSWLNNVSSGQDEIITLKNGSTIVNQVTYKNSGAGTVVGADDIGSVPVGQSVARTADGGSDWVVDATPSKGWSNALSAPTTVYVDDNASDVETGSSNQPFNTIAEGIDSVAIGGAVNVAAGEYDEADIEVTTPNVTIQGSGIGQGVSRAIINGSSCGDVSPAAIFHLHEDGITLKGFEIDGSNCGAEHVVHVGDLSEITVNGVTVSDNAIHSGENGVTISWGSTDDPVNPNVVSDNEIFENENGVYLTSAPNNAIQNNTIRNNNSYGILIDENDCCGGFESEGNQITGNTITDNGSGGIYTGGDTTISDITISNNNITSGDEGGGDAIHLEQVAGGSGTITINGNEISSNFGYGIYIGSILDNTVNITDNQITGNDSDGIYIDQVGEQGDADSASTVTISENTVSSNEGRGIYIWSVDEASEVVIDGNIISENNNAGIYLDEETQGVSITENTISNNGGDDTGIVVNQASGNSAHLNKITGNGEIEVQNNDGVNAFDVTQNWWGTAVSSEIEAKISGTVTYSPWYTNAEMTTLASLSSDKAISSFSFPEGTGVINETNHTISVNVPFGTDVTALTSTISITTGAAINLHAAVQDFTSPVTYTVRAADSSTQDYTVTVTVLDNNQTAPDAGGVATINNSTPEVVIINPTQAVDLTIGNGTTNPTIDLSSFISGGTGTIPQITITSNNAGNANIAIPASTTVTSADPAWNGVIAAPTVTTVTLPETSGETKTLSTAIEVGFVGAKLSFDNAVRILLPGQTGKRAGYIRPGIAFTEITNTCSADNQTTGDILVVDGDCKIDVGSDLVIWTKHFTKFAAYTQTTNSTSSSSSSTSSSSGSGGDGKSDGLGCGSNDCSGGGGAVPAATTPESQVLGTATQLATAFGLTEEVLGTQTTEEEQTQSETEEAGDNQIPTPSSEDILGEEDQPQGPLTPNNVLIIIAVLILIFGLGYYFFFRKT